jgi:FtsH-binding integral membrane protein
MAGSDIEDDMNRYRSRTYWLCWGIVLLSTVLCSFGRIEGAGWITCNLGVLAAWQLRRAHDNKLFEEEL